MIFTQHSQDNNKAIDICLTTNDSGWNRYSKVALMTIVGQQNYEYIPTKAELEEKKWLWINVDYIGPFRPRDRSHYEKFKAIMKISINLLNQLVFVTFGSIRSRCLCNCDWSR